MLVQATGGAVKPAKSFWYLLSWRFQRGKPVLKQKSEYNSLSLAVPQPNSTPATIPLLDNLHTEKTLGVWSNPLNDPCVPLTKRKEKGLSWIDGVRLNDGTCGSALPPWNTQNGPTASARYMHHPAN